MAISISKLFVVVILAVCAMSSYSYAEMDLLGGSSLFPAMQSPQNEDNSSMKKQIEFADFLYSEKQYEFATKEYLKLYYFNKSDYLEDRVAKSAYYAKDYKTAKTFLYKVFNHDKTSSIYSKLFFILEKDGAYDEALAVAKKIGDESLWYQSKYNYYLGNIDSAKVLLANSNATSNSVTASEILKIMEDERTKKSYALGLVTSIIPGGGYFYTERYGDAVFANLLIIPLAVISTLYYVNDEKTKAYVWGSIGGAFYVGTIYGGVRSVNLYNKQIERYKDFHIKEKYNSKEYW